MLLAALFLVMGTVWAQYYVIESVGENITDLNALTEDSYVALYNVGKSKYIYEGGDHKLYMGTAAIAGAGHEYIWQVHKDGEKFLFTSASGRYFSTPLDAKDVYAVKSDNAAKDMFTITAHQEDDTKWLVQSTNNSKYWDAQDARFVGWAGSGANSRYEIRPVTVSAAVENDFNKLITTNEDDIKWYTIKNVRKQKYATYAGDAATMTQQETVASAASFFYFTGRATDESATVGIHNLLAGDKLCTDYNLWTATGREWLIKKQETGLSIAHTNNESKAWNDASGGGQKIEYWNASDPGSAWQIEIVTDFTEHLTAAKAAAILEIEKLSGVSAIYPDVAQYISEIEGVTENSAEGLLTINNILENYRKSIDGKSMKFRVDGRGSRFLGYSKDNDRIETQVLGFDDAYWTLKYVGNGYFKLYNPVHKVWLGAPDGAKKTIDEKETSYTAGLADEADASSYKFEVTTGGTTVLLVAGNGKIAHAANGNYIMHYGSTTDEASWWAIIDACTFQMTYDEYKEFLTKKSTLMNQLIGYAKQLQDNYGLVKSGDKIAVVVNHPSGGDSQPSSNLLDGNNGTYVHSSYDGSTMNTVENHYIEVELSEAAQNIFCYFSKRNDKNRPAVIKVYAGNSAYAIDTHVGTLNMAESLDGSIQSYFSAGLDLGAAYSHLRFVVTQTNTGTKFFTLSEFYVLPINDDTRNIAELTSASITDINTSERIENAQSYLNMLNNALKFPKVKKLLDDNKEKHAATPLLGQYPTEAYNALKDALKSADATEESLNAAVAEFETSLNAPVYIISGVYDYAKDKAIYYNGTDPVWRWDTKNAYNKAMWFRIPGLTTSEFALETDYNIVDMNGRNLYDKKAIKFYTIENWEGVYNLKFGAAGDDYIHAGNHSNNIVTYWYAATMNDCQASAWKVEFLGNSYDLNKLTEEYFAAVDELAAISVPNFSFAAGVNNYDAATKPALDAAIANRAAVLGKLATAEEIADAKAQLEEAIANVKINLPLSGHYYRIRCADEESGMKRLQSTIIEGGDRLELKAGDEGINDGSIFYYTEGGLMSYTEKKFIDAYSFVEGGNVPQVTFSAAANGALGCYNIKINNRYIFGADSGNKIDSGTNTDSRAGYNWWLEEADLKVINDYKTPTLNTLDTWAKLSVLFDADLVTKAKEAVNALDDVVKLSEVDNMLQNLREAADGKSVKFENCATDARGGRYLGYDKAKSRIAGVLSNNDDVLWTIKFIDNNTFKLYNFVNNIWLGGPDYKWDESTTTNEETGEETTTKSNYRTPAIETEADAVVYKFIIRDNNKVTLSTTTNKIAHLSGNDNYRIMQYGSNDDASNWMVLDAGTIQLDREGYNAFVASKSDLMNQLVGYAKQLQDEYGLVKTGDKIAVVVNHPEGGDSQPSSNLLDGNNGTFVHSSYDTTMEGEGDNKTMSEGHMNQVEAHYIEVELSEAAQNIFCYFSKRNNNNRPFVVTVLAGNSADALNEVATLNMAESTDGSVQSYFSEAIDLGAAYTHLRFVVTNTNTGSKFFTLSEFYVLPINATTEGIAALAGASIIDTDLEARLAAADNSLKTFQLPEVKAEVKAVLDANAENHAEEPQLGQYASVAYNALNDTYKACTTSDKLDALREAFEMFKKAKNRPVFTIGNGNVKDYAKDKSIYDDNDGTLNFKATNVYDKTMWWALDMTETAVKVTEEVGIYNVGTGNGFWGASSIKVTETNENDGAGIADDNIFLFYTTGNSTPVHFQAAYSEIVRWGSYDAKSGSAAMFTYIGNTYDLDKLTDEYFAAANELAAMTVPDFTFSVGLNNYNPETKPALDAAIANRAAVLSKFSTAEEIATAKAQLDAAIAGVQINMPVNGKFYRVRCAGEGMKRIQSTINNERLQMIGGDEGINANSIFCYIDGSLLSYTTGQYINAYDLDAVGTKSAVVFSEAYNGTLGQYNININDRYIYGKKNEIDSGTGNPTDNGYNWWLEEVTTLPVSISEVGYTTFYTPIAVTVPETVEAYIVQEIISENGTQFLDLIQVTGVVPAHTGLILKGEAGTYNFKVVATAAEDEQEFASNLLKGTNAKTVITPETGYTCYVLSKPAKKPEEETDPAIGFYPIKLERDDNGEPLEKDDKGNIIEKDKATSFINGANKVYLPVKTAGGQAPALMFRFGTSEIEHVDATQETETRIYDLMGRRVEKMVEGIYIVNGKKVVIK